MRSSFTHVTAPRYAALLGLLMAVCVVSWLGFGASGPAAPDSGSDALLAASPAPRALLAKSGAAPLHTRGLPGGPLSSPEYEQEVLPDETEHEGGRASQGRRVCGDASSSSFLSDTRSPVRSRSEGRLYQSLCTYRL